MPEKTHFADHGVRSDAPHSQGLAFAIHDFHRKIASGHQVDGVCRLTFPIENPRTVGVLALEITHQIGGTDERAELLLQPWLEAGETCILLQICRTEQSVLTPSKREV